MSSQTIRSYFHQEFETLKKSSSLLHSLIENTNYGLAIITSDFHVVDVNSKMLEWFPEIKTEPFPVCYEHFYGSPRSVCFQCPAVACIKKEKKCSAFIETSNSEKGFTNYKVTCTPLKGPDEKVWGVLEIAEDVTENTKKERNLKELETQYRQIIKKVNDPIITINSDGKILQANQKAQHLYGYTAQELRGKSILCLIPEDRHEKQRNAIKEFFLRKRCPETAIEGVGLKKDGRIIPLEITYSFIKTTRGDIVTAILRDISERKTHEGKLKTYAKGLEHKVKTQTKKLAWSEERYHALVETANDAIISANKKGEIIYFNKKAEELFGYTREEVMGQNISEIAPDEIREMAQLELNTRYTSTQEKMLESYGIKKDKTTFPVEYTISVFERDRESNLTLIARDRTIRKRLEQKLQQYTVKLEEKVRERTYELTASQQSLKEKISELSILKEIGEALSSTIDLEAVVKIILVGATSHHGLGFNRAFLFLVNNDASCLEGKIAIGPSDNTEAQKIWSEIIGKRLSLKEILQSYTNKTGQVDTHVNDIIRNIKTPLSNENHILAHAIKKKEPLNIIDAFNHPMVPKQLLTIMNCNAFVLVPLLVEDKVLGVLWADNAITKRPIENQEIDKLRAFAISASLAIEKTNLYKNIQEKVAELDKANQELQKNRDRLIRSEKLAAVGEMSATVAHGIRNPLVSIGGFARRLLKKEEENSINRKYLQIIVEEIDRLETILSELLDFVRPRKLNLRNLCLNELIENTLQFFYFELEKRNIKVEKLFMSDLPPLELDPDQFKRVLHNLFNNAMDAMPDGGVLKIAIEIEDNWIKTSISDTGVGISDDEIEKVFHPFFTSKETGSGLGLAICNQIISIHGGQIKLRRQIPYGVIFDIYLPITKQ